MRRIRTATFVSLNGVMQAPGGSAEDPTGGIPFGLYHGLIVWSGLWLRNASLRAAFPIRRTVA